MIRRGVVAVAIASFGLANCKTSGNRSSVKDAASDSIDGSGGTTNTGLPNGLHCTFIQGGPQNAANLFGSNPIDLVGINGSQGPQLPWPDGSLQTGRVTLGQFQPAFSGLTLNNVVVIEFSDGNEITAFAFDNNQDFLSSATGSGTTSGGTTGSGTGFGGTTGSGTTSGGTTGSGTGFGGTTGSGASSGGTTRSGASFGGTTGSGTSSGGATGSGTGFGGTTGSGTGAGGGARSFSASLYESSNERDSKFVGKWPLSCLPTNDSDTGSGATTGSGPGSGGTTGTTGSGTGSGGTTGSGTGSGGTTGSDTGSGGTTGSDTGSGGTTGSDTGSGGTTGSSTGSGSGGTTGSDSGFGN